MWSLVLETSDSFESWTRCLMLSQENQEKSCSQETLETRSLSNFPPLSTSLHGPVHRLSLPLSPCPSVSLLSATALPHVLHSIHQPIHHQPSFCAVLTGQPAASLPSVCPFGPFILPSHQPHHPPLLNWTPLGLGPAGFQTLPCSTLGRAGLGALDRESLPHICLLSLAPPPCLHECPNSCARPHHSHWPWGLCNSPYLPPNTPSCTDKGCYVSPRPQQCCAQGEAVSGDNIGFQHTRPSSLGLSGALVSGLSIQGPSFSLPGGVTLRLLTYNSILLLDSPQSVSQLLTGQGTPKPQAPCGPVPTC